MNFGVIKKNDIANGPGVRVNLFVSGCTHRCEDCFNENTWNFASGEPFTDSHLDEILEAMAPDYVAGFTFLGGEPFEAANRGEVLRIAAAIKEKYPEKSIWAYSGYLFEELMAWAGLWNEEKVPSSTLVPRNRVDSSYKPANDASNVAKLLNLIDILVDGEYDKSKRNIRLQFRGSENQRIIDVKKSIVSGEVIPWAELNDRPLATQA